MSWNYRLIEKNISGETLFRIHEVYYDEDGIPNGVTKKPVYPQADSKEKFKDQMKLYNEALEKPILKYEKI